MLPTLNDYYSQTNNYANSCCLPTKLLAYCPVAHPSLVQVYNLTLMSLHSSLVLAIVERLEFV